MSAYSAQADIYLDLEDYEKAIRDYQITLELEPDMIGAYLSIGYAYEAAGDHKAALANYWEWHSRYFAVTEEGLHLLDGQTRQVQMELGKRYLLGFRGRTGRRVTITAYSPTTDALLFILGPDGQPLTFIDDISKTNFNAEIEEFLLPESGTYTLVLTHAGGGASGEFTLTFEISE